MFPVLPQISKRDGKVKKSEPIVTSFDGKPLKSFSLYLPPHLPASIVTDASSFASYTLMTAATYLGLWKLDKSMEAVDIRLPAEYLKHLQDDPSFLPNFFGVFFDNLSAVKSVNELYFPTITIKTNSCSGLVDTFRALSATSCSIKHALLPISFAMESSTLANLDFTKMTKVVQTVSTVKLITLISSSDMLLQFSDLFHKAIPNVWNLSVKISTSNDDASVPGPAYLTDLGKSLPIGENINPHALLASLNTCSSSGGGDGRKNSSHSGSGGAGRSRPKGVR